MGEYTRSIQLEQRQTLATALLEKKFADVTFVVGQNGTQHSINRVFLSLISPVFASMLSVEMDKMIKPHRF